MSWQSTAQAQPLNQGTWNPLQNWLPPNQNNSTNAYDPVQGLLDNATGNGGSNQGQAPASPLLNIQDPSASLPNNPVDLSTGTLHLEQKDYSFTTYGPNLQIDRSYYSSRADHLSLFGYGWTIPEDRYIQIFANFTMTDFQADGSTVNYLYTKNDPNLRVDSYDGDSLIYYPLDQGAYKPEDPNNQSALTRRSATDYLLTDKEGNRFVFNGYKTKWRTNAPADAGRLIRYANRKGFEIELTYDSAGHIVQMKGNQAPTLTLAYTGDLVTSVTDAQGRVTHYNYDSNKNLTTIINPDGSTEQMSYDSSHRIINRTVQGATNHYEYDSQGRVTKVENGDGTPVYSYSYGNHTVTVTDSAGQTVTYSLDNKNQIITKTDSTGTIFYAYDDHGNVVEIDSPQGKAIYAYDGNGNLIKEVDPLGHETDVTYDTNLNLPTKIVKPGGATWVYTYDDKGTLLSSTDPLGHQITYQIDPYWEVPVVRQNPDGTEETYQYNDYADLTAITDEAGRTTYLDRDNADRLIAIRYPDGRKVTLRYDGGDHATTVIQPDGSELTYTYQNGQLTESTDAAGNVTTYQYDNNGHLLKTTDPLKQTTTYSYDALGHLVGMTDPTGASISFTWNNLGQLVSKKGNSIPETDYTYDSEGQLKQVKSPGQTFTYTVTHLAG